MRTVTNQGAAEGVNPGTTVHWTRSLTQSRYVWDVVLLISFVTTLLERARFVGEVDNVAAAMAALDCC